MGLSTLILLSQLMLAALFGLLVSVGSRKVLAYRHKPEVIAAQSKMLAWPEPFPRMAASVAFLLPLIEPLVRPSARIRHDLMLVGRSSEFDDREFVKMRYILAVLGAAAGVLIMVCALLLSYPDISPIFFTLPAVFGLGGFILPRVSLRDRSIAVVGRVQRNFPSFLDVFALTLESGQNFQSALMLSVQHLSEPTGQPGLKAQLQEVLRLIRAGQSRMQALQQLSDRLALPEVVQFVASVAASEKQGVSVTTLLRRQSEQLRMSRALAAERHAMKLPVKLLGPLAICIFPCTFLVLAFPIGMQLLGSGIF